VIDLIRAEYIKIRTVRSTMIMLLLVVLLSVVPAVLIALLVGKDDLLTTEPWDRVQIALIGVQFSQVLVAVIAALVIAGEFRFGTIRTTFVAEPRRLHVLAAKLVTVLALAGVVSALMVGISAGLTKLILDSRGIAFSFTAFGAGRLLYGTVLYSMFYAAMGLAIATILRNAAASITLVIVIPLIVENVVFGIFSVLDHESWAKWLPFTAGAQITADTSGQSLTERFAPWTGYGYACLWAVALLGLGAWLLDRRDA
jgi:ABC-2 type transport system permease protein